MPKTTLPLLALAALAATGSAHAAEDAMSSTATADQAGSGLLTDRPLALLPTAGVILFTDNNGDGAARAAGGLLIEGNFSKALSKTADMTFLGAQTGFIYSHVGATGADFFGSGSSTPTTASGANLLIVPTNLIVGWNTGWNARICVHGGGNVVYRSIADSMPLGDTPEGPGSSWNYYPNVGLDFEAGLGKRVAASFRPDATFTTGKNVYELTVALSFKLG